MIERVEESSYSLLDLPFRFIGSAGQSFGCFLMPGMNIRLVGEANDYVGKVSYCIQNLLYESSNEIAKEDSLTSKSWVMQGMAGGELVIVPPENVGFCPEDGTIVGNTCLYGATGGQMFARGKAGERFAVRNSLAEAVIEGTGDHCCEYMTGGCIVVLGK